MQIPLKEEAMTDSDIEMMIRPQVLSLCGTVPTLLHPDLSEHLRWSVREGLEAPARTTGRLQEKN